MGQIDSPLQNAFREVSQISSGTTCSEKQNHTENRKTKGGGHHSEDKHIRKHWDEDSVIQMLKSENPAFTRTL